MAYFLTVTALLVYFWTVTAPLCTCEQWRPPLWTCEWWLSPFKQCAFVYALFKGWNSHLNRVSTSLNWEWNLPSSWRRGATTQWLILGYARHSEAVCLISASPCRPRSSDEGDALEVRVEQVYRDLLAKEVCAELSDWEKEALPLFAEAYSK